MDELRKHRETMTDEKTNDEMALGTIVAAWLAKRALPLDFLPLACDYDS